jgi:hypothetical protein
VTGRNAKTWKNEAFPEGFELVGTLVAIDELDDDAVVTAGDLGVLVWTGDPDLDPTGGRGISASRALRDFLREDGFSIVSVALPKGREREILDTIVALGGKPLRK